MQIVGLNEDEREYLLERASLREYDGGHSRNESETLAWQDLIEYQNRKRREHTHADKK